VTIGNNSTGATGTVNVGTGAANINIGSTGPSAIVLGRTGGSVTLGPPLTLGAAPTTSTQLGYFYTIATNSESSQSTFPANAYSPSTGSSANFLTPGIYILSVYSYIYNANTTSTTSVPIEVGVYSNATTTPTSGSIQVDSILSGINLIPSGVQTCTFFPTFTFKVTTSGYYYSKITASSGASNGNYVLGVRTIFIARVG
jgi:hypothetical protein